jgi:D-psicose/D-tagatose/L-ribulose 3-epimerase
MRLGICNVIDNAAAIKEAGYDFLELTVPLAIQPEVDDATWAPIREKLLKTPIPIEAFNMLFPAHIRVTGPNVDMPRIKKYLETTLARVALTGARLVVFGSGAARRLVDGWPAEKGWAQLEEVARLAGELAGRHNITIVMEPLCAKGCNFFKLVAQGIPFVDKVNHPHLQLLADHFHMTGENEPNDNATKAGKRLLHVHVGTPSLPETAPGVKYDYKPFIAALRKGGYAARISVEDNPGVIGGLGCPNPVPLKTLQAIRAHMLAAF